MPRNALFAVLFLACLVSQSCLVESIQTEGVRLKQLGKERFAFTRDDLVSRILRPYFDDEGRLRWNDGLIHVRATGDCDTDPPQPGPNGVRPLYPRSTVLLMPRVDERRCVSDDGKDVNSTLLGIDADGDVTWQRPVVLLSDSRRFPLWLIGTDPNGLVLSDLEVWSPFTGETVVNPRTHPVRGVPENHVYGCAFYHSKRRQIFFFKADVTLVKREGGLYVFDPSTGERELVTPVAATLSGTYDQIKGMAVDPTGRYLVLAQTREIRGPGSVSLAVVDLDSRKMVFLQRYGEGDHADYPSIVAHGNEIGFSYRDDRRGKFVLLHFRLETPP